MAISLNIFGSWQKLESKMEFKSYGRLGIMFQGIEAFLFFLENENETFHNQIIEMEVTYFLSHSKA